MYIHLCKRNTRRIKPNAIDYSGIGWELGEKNEKVGTGW